MERRWWQVGGGVAVVLALVLGVLWLTRDEPAPTPPRARPATPSATPTPAPPPVAPDPCAGSLAGGFVPTGVSVDGVLDRARVLARPRDARDVPGTPPVSDRTSFAWDRGGVEPGSTEGHVLLNTHTYPDGGASGNRLLRGLRLGGTLRLTGDDGRVACYRVTTRVEVPAADGYPGWKAVDGPPEVVIVVCSGRRTGPGRWTHRTLWFAEPVVTSAPVAG